VTAPTVRDGVLHLGGRPQLLLIGDYPYYRDDPRRWPAKLAALRAAGLTTVSFYVPWRHHEIDGRFVFDGPGNRDLTGFLAAIAEAGLYALAKPGPHVHAELPLGGLPDRLRPDRDPRLRAARGPVRHGRELPSLGDPVFAAEVDRWLAAAGDALKQWCFPNGPLIAVQAGNEGLYGETALAFDEYDPDRVLGDDLARFADGLGLDVPAFANLSPPAPGRFAAWQARGLPEHPHYGFTNWAGDTATDDSALDRFLLAATRARGPNLEENWSLGWAYPGWQSPATPIFNGLLGLACGATGLTVYTACATGDWGPDLAVPGIDPPYGADAPIGLDARPGPAFEPLRVLTHFLAAEGAALVTAAADGPVAGAGLIDVRRGPFRFLLSRSPEPRRVLDGPVTVELAGYGVAVLRVEDGRLLSAYAKGIDERGDRNASVMVEVGGRRLTTAGPCDLALIHRAGRPEIRHTGDPSLEVILP
jgi:beta-galactosidase